MTMSTPSQSSRFRSVTRQRTACGAFTLIEVLISITLIIVLATFILAITTRMKRSAAKVNDMNNLRSLATAAMAAGGDNAGMLPQFHAGAKQGNSNAAPYWVIGRSDLEAAGINKESCYAPTRNIYGGAPGYRWWYDYGETSTPIHYCYFASDGSTRSNAWFTKGSVTPPSKKEYRGAIPYDVIIRDNTKAFARTLTDDAWYPVLWAGLCRDYAGSPRVAALMDDGEALGVNVMFLDGHAEWIEREKMKVRYTSGSLQVYW